MTKLKDKILFIVIFGLAILLMLQQCSGSRNIDRLKKKLESANREIVKLDTLKKEKDGQYAKLVDNFKTESDLKRSLSDQNKDLSNLIKSKNERILMLNNSIISLKSKSNSGSVVVDTVDQIVKLNIQYPNKTNPFINWKGQIYTQNSSYSGEWTFGDLPISVVLTETERGLWNSRMIGPDWLTVDSIRVDALPANKIVKSITSDFGILVGGGIQSSSQSRGISVGIGANYKNSNLIFRYGSIGNTIGLSYYHRIKYNKNQ